MLFARPLFLLPGKVFAPPARGYFILFILLHPVLFRKIDYDNGAALFFAGS